MSDCPDRDLLERLLDNRLADTELDELDRHVKGCASCQQALEELTDDRRWISELRHEVTQLSAATELERAGDPPGVTDGATAAAKGSGARVAPAVPGYEISGELGRGGMGVVYHARHVRLNRPCALKMILAGAHAGPEDLARFVTEAEAIARLQHPSIVQIRHIGDADGLPFLELEYVAGGSLDRQLDGTPWPPTQAARLAEQVALGIAEAHRQGIVHRDLKPSNVFLAADGTPKVGDFGLAKMLDRQAMLTRSESVMGSPSYMAPEQASGHAREAGPAVDVYAVGAVLYELLTGRPPFRGTTANETLEQVKTTEPVPPSRLVPGVPRDVETICLQCLQKEPGKRYETAEALGDDLRRSWIGRPIPSAADAAAWERAWRSWCRRNRLVAAMTGIARRAPADHAGGFGATHRGSAAFRRPMLPDARKPAGIVHGAGPRHAIQPPGGVAIREPPCPGRRRPDRARPRAAAGTVRSYPRSGDRLSRAPRPEARRPGDRPARRHALLLLRPGDETVRAAARVGDDPRPPCRRTTGKPAGYPGPGAIAAHPPLRLQSGRLLTWSTRTRLGDGPTVWDLDRDRTGGGMVRPFQRNRTPDFSPDSRRIAVTHHEGDLVIYDLETGRPRRVRSGPKNP